MAAVPPESRPFDPVASAAALRRLALAPQPPWLHGEVARRMAERLTIVKSTPGLILDWWSFLGAGAGLLERTYPQSRRIAVEPEALLAVRRGAMPRRRWWLPRAARAEVMPEDADLPDGAGLIWANMMLHAVADPPALFARWERLLGGNGFVMFSTLGPGTLRALRDLYTRFGWGSPAAPLVDMHDYGDMLLSAGFADPVMDQETLVLQWDSAAALLSELRQLGRNTAPDRACGLRTPRWRERLLRELDALRGTDGRISLGFEIAYGHAFKAAPRLRRDEPTTVSLDDMRALVRAPRPVRRQA